MFSFAEIVAVPDELVERSNLQKAMLFELAIARAEFILDGKGEPSWDDCLRVSADRQRRHYDAKIPLRLEEWDLDAASHAADNLVAMLRSVQSQHLTMTLQRRFCDFRSGMDCCFYGRLFARHYPH